MEEAAQGKCHIASTCTQSVCGEATIAVPIAAGEPDGCNIPPLCHTPTNVWCRTSECTKVIAYENGRTTTPRNGARLLPAVAPVEVRREDELKVGPAKSFGNDTEAHLASMSKFRHRRGGRLHGRMVVGFLSTAASV